MSDYQKNIQRKQGTQKQHVGISEELNKPEMFDAYYTVDEVMAGGEAREEQAKFKGRTQEFQLSQLSNYQGISQHGLIDTSSRTNILPQQSRSGVDGLGREAELGPTQEAAREALANPAQGVKHDQGKEPLALLSTVWLLGVARVMGFGAVKYAAHNWRQGLQRSRLVSAAMRHILAYNEGEDKDPETGLSHLDHASCCLMFAREMHETHSELDDRYKGAKK